MSSPFFPYRRHANLFRFVQVSAVSELFPYQASSHRTKPFPCQISSSVASVPAVFNSPPLQLFVFSASHLFTITALPFKSPGFLSVVALVRIMFLLYQVPPFCNSLATSVSDLSVSSHFFQTSSGSRCSAQPETKSCHDSLALFVKHIALFAGKPCNVNAVLRTCCCHGKETAGSSVGCHLVLPPKLPEGEF